MSLTVLITAGWILLTASSGLLLLSEERQYHPLFIPIGLLLGGTNLFASSVLWQACASVTDIDQALAIAATPALTAYIGLWALWRALTTASLLYRITSVR